MSESIRRHNSSLFQVTYANEEDAFIVDNRLEDPIKLLSKDRHLIIATFSKTVLYNMGRSESFAKKVVHFYKELKKTLHHGIDEQREPIQVPVDREDVLNSVSLNSLKFKDIIIRCAGYRGN